MCWSCNTYTNANFDDSSANANANANFDDSSANANRFNARSDPY
jgi:hypothetical protein